MSLKVKTSLLAAAVVSATALSQAKASFLYDLRFAPTQTAPGVVDSHDANVSVGTYTLQLWGQITGNTTMTDDGWVQGFVDIMSGGTGTAIKAGGVTSAVLGTHASSPAAGAIIGTGGTDINGDGITDWGSTSSTTSGWLKWAGGANPGFPDGVADTQSQQVNATTWEILLATFTVNVTSVGSGSTTFTPTYVESLHAGFSTNQGIVYTQDGAPVSDITAGPSNGATTATSVTFNAVPEPASLGVLALGALGLLARRRK